MPAKHKHAMREGKQLTLDMLTPYVGGKFTLTTRNGDMVCGTVTGLTSSCKPGRRADSITFSLTATVQRMAWNKVDPPLAVLYDHYVLYLPFYCVQETAANLLVTSRLTQEAILFELPPKEVQSNVE